MLPSTHTGFTIFIGILFIGFCACKTEIVPDYFQPRNDHEAYQYGLEQANLLETALGQDWIAAAHRSLESPISVSVPHMESFYFDPKSPKANGYLLSAKRGQKIEIEVIRQHNEDGRLFMDLFRVDSSEEETLNHVATAPNKTYVIGFEPRVSGSYLLRVQPELLRGGRLTLSIKVVPSLSFPVEGGSNRDIGSFFGDPRDGGRRKHHGIDIFAKRHTPILAPTDGHIRFAGERGLGGQVVWMRDRQRDITLYFAHLHYIGVSKGERVQKGDTIGTVGNTGNARTTPPHLHFGIYQDGPMDPFDFVALTNDTPKPIKADQDLVGKKVRMRKAGRLTHLPDNINRSGRTLRQHQLLEVDAAVANHFRVKLPDGTVGLVGVKEVEQINQPIAQTEVSQQIQLLDSPSEDSSIIREINDLDRIEILAKDVNHWYVNVDSVQKGWVVSQAP